MSNFSKPVVTIILPKSPHISGNFCTGVKIFHFSRVIIFGQLLQIFGDFLLVTMITGNKHMAHIYRWPLLDPRQVQLYLVGNNTFYERFNSMRRDDMTMALERERFFESNFLLNFVTFSKRPFHVVAAAEERLLNNSNATLICKTLFIPPSTYLSLPPSLSL